MRKPFAILLSVGAILISSILFAQAIPVYATAGQWSASGSVIYYNDGQVGIGTSAPATNRLLDLGNNTSTNTYLRLNAGASYQSTLEFSAGGVQKWALYRPGDSSDLRLWDGSEDRFTFTSGENGTKLDIKAGTANWLEFDNTINGSKYVFHSPTAADRLEIGVYDASTATMHWDRLKFYKDGSIVMGSSGDQVNFQVNGELKTRKVTVTNANWADYVFNKNYSLMPLEDVQSYINQNGHLPNIPSAEEVAENGQSLGDLQTKQMEKIEELTLYIIQQDQRISTLEQKLSELTK